MEDDELRKRLTDICDWLQQQQRFNEEIRACVLDLAKGLMSIGGNIGPGAATIRQQRQAVTNPHLGSH